MHRFGGAQLRRQRQLLHRAFDLVAGQSLPGALPAGLHLLHLSGGRVGQQAGAHGLVKWQAVDNLRHSRQIEFVGLGLATRRGLAARRQVTHTHIAARPVQAVAGIELQVLSEKIKALIELAATQPTCDGFEFQRLEAGLESDTDLGQRHISHHTADLTPVHIDPGIECAIALGEVNTQIHITAQCRQIHPGVGGVNLALP